MTRVAFVLGTGRCGSTLVHEVLARHEQTGFLTNLDDLGICPSSAWQNRLWRRLPPEVTTKGRARFAPTEGYRLLAREVAPMLGDPVRDLTALDATPWVRRRFTALVEDRVERLAAPVFLHKLTGWPRVGLLDACFPEAVFLEVVRDGRAVANSWLQMPWWRGHLGPEHWNFGPLPADLHEEWERSGRSFPVLPALGWRLLTEAYDQTRRLVTEERWLRVRHEDVVADPRAAFGAALDALGLEWTPAFEHGFARHTFTRTRTDAYRRDLSEQDLAAVESVLGGHLAGLGYG